MTYDPDNWLISATREIGAYVTILLNDPDVDVEMSWPDTTAWTKQTPLTNSLIHFEQDDSDSPVLGFGVPGVDVFDYTANSYELHEAAQHMVNFDVGVWVSAEGGGSTRRMGLVQALKNIFATAGGRVAFNEATGLNAISFNGGGNHLDRINDLPIWRTIGMTLVVRVFSRHIPDTPDVIPADGFDQEQDLTIDELPIT